MKSRILRSALVVLALAAQGAAGFFLVRVEGQKAAARESLDALVRDSGRVQALVGELRSAEAGVVATGQDATEWVPRLAGLIRNTTDALKKIDRAGLSPDSAQDLAAATDAIAAFARTSDRVRDLLATDQPLTASSVVFGDAAQHLGTAATAVASVASSQAQAVEREIARLRLLQIYALAGATGLTLIVLLLLLPRVERVAIDESTTEIPATGPGLSMARRGDADPLPSREPERQIEEEARHESGPRRNTDPQVNLAEAARLCSDLARVKDGSELAGLLARVAELLDAAGIVLWIVGPEGSALRPAASHGYSEHALARMRTLSGRSENAVSVAFRTGQMEVVRGTGDRHGAVVAPVIAAGGCVGVIAAEIRHGAEISPSVQAVATIVAAQLASLVAESATS
jgi:hypothetical protein